MSDHSGRVEGTGVGCEWRPHRRKGCGQHIPLREEEQRGTGGEDGGRTQSSSAGNEAGEEGGREEGGGGPTWESVVCGPPNQKSACWWVEGGAAAVEERIGWGSGIVSWGKGCGTRDTCARSHLIISEKPSRGDRAAVWRS